MAPRKGFCQSPFGSSEVDRVLSNSDVEEITVPSDLVEWSRGYVPSVLATYLLFFFLRNLFHLEDPLG